MQVRVSSALGAAAIMVAVMLVPVLGAVGGGSSDTALRVEELELDRSVAAPPAQQLEDHGHEPGPSVDADDGDDGSWWTTTDIPAGEGVMVGADWGGTDAEVAVRARQDGEWTDWYPLEISSDQPEGAEAEDANPDASAPVWFGASEAFQVRASEPVELDLNVVDETASPSAPAATAEAATTIRSRAAWNADETLRDGRVDYASSLNFGVIHHEGGTPRWSDSDIANGCPDAAAAIRAIYRYHVQAQGWWDIGYNFVVDPCGTIWEGRWGGIDRNVVGAHAAGFNTGSFGVLALGTFHGSAADPVTQRLTRGLEDIFAHKFSLAGIDATTFVDHKGGCSGCSSRYGPSTTVRLPRVSAHQVTSHTACPGDDLLAELFTGAGADARPRSWFTRNIGDKTTLPETLPTFRWSGSDRIATAVQTSRNTFDSADAVVVATSEAYADGLVAGPLAASRDAPVLLTRSDRLSDVVADEIGRLGARRAYVVGGKGVVSNSVVNDLRAAGASLVWRLGGENRYETAERVADDIRSRSGGRAVLLALGDHPTPNRAFPDALTAGAFGASTGSPVLLAKPDQLPTATRRALRGGSGTGDVNQAAIFGGTSAIAPSVVEAARDAVPGSVNTRRFAGRNRYETATLAMQDLVNRGKVTDRRVFLVSGVRWPDALAAAGAAGELARPLLLVPSSSGYRGSGVEETVAGWNPLSAVVIGGTAAVSSRVVDEIRTTR